MKIKEITEYLITAAFDFARIIHVLEYEHNIVNKQLLKILLHMPKLIFKIPFSWKSLAGIIPLFP